jgi:phosphoribosyl 1,2-cyclic phosphodiesterase
VELRFWGVRGSIAAPGPDTVSVGGNTICVSLRYKDYIFIFDAGTGIRSLGHHLESKERSQWRGAVFLTHYHWDHIQGLPFFAPAFRSDNRFSIYGEPKKGLSINKLLCEQMETPYFPIEMDCLEGLVNFVGVQPNMEINVFTDATIRTIRLSHPSGAIGYRFDSPNGSMSFITDHEHPEERLDDSVVKFVQTTKILIHDAQYTPEEKRGPMAGYGHSSWEEAALTARKANVKRLYLIHHDPDRTDEALLVILNKARRVFPHTEIATESTVVAF